MANSNKLLGRGLAHLCSPIRNPGGLGGEDERRLWGSEGYELIKNAGGLTEKVRILGKKRRGKSSSSRK